MPLYYPSWLRHSFTLEKVLEVNGSPDPNSGAMFFRIEVLFSEASNLYVARCYRRLLGHAEGIWRLESETEGHGNMDDAIQRTIDIISERHGWSETPAE